MWESTLATTSFIKWGVGLFSRVVLFLRDCGLHNIWQRLLCVKTQAWLDNFAWYREITIICYWFSLETRLFVPDLSRSSREKLLDKIRNGKPGFEAIVGSCKWPRCCYAGPELSGPARSVHLLGGLGHPPPPPPPPPTVLQWLSPPCHKALIEAYKDLFFLLEWKVVRPKPDRFRWPCDVM